METGGNNLNYQCHLSLKLKVPIRYAFNKVVFKFHADSIGTHTQKEVCSRGHNNPSLKEMDRKRKKELEKRNK